jgi:hypothetical protein
MRLTPIREEENTVLVMGLYFRGSAILPLSPQNFSSKLKMPKREYPELYFAEMCAQV